MSKASDESRHRRDEVEVKNQCEVTVIGPRAPVYRHRFIFVTLVPRRIFELKPSSRFKAANLGHVTGTLSRKEIYEDLD
jgi:hypothetical protein